MTTDAQPIAHRVDPTHWRSQEKAEPGWPVSLLTRARALQGMQKEAVVAHEPSGACWRLLCDEGPWLNGTDLAPFPLGYFAAGIAACLLSDIRAEAGERSVASAGLSARLDIRFTMDGSILKGTMAAGVQSFDLQIRAADAGDGGAELTAVAQRALERRSAVNAMLAASLPSRFRLRVDGEAVPWTGRAAESLQNAEDPGPLFDGLAAEADAGGDAAIVRKAGGGDAAPAGGAVGLQGDQKRVVHLSAEARLRDDGLQEIAARCVQPAGSRFVLLSDESPNPPDAARAPCGLAYLSAGVAFCYMTQLGRYAQIRKLALDGYRIVQQTAFGDGGASPVETAVFLDSADPRDDILKMVQMGEQTCYAHATFRSPVALNVQGKTAP